MSYYAFDIEPQAEDTDPLFPVKQNGKWGYINACGRIVIKPQFDHAEDFHEGFAVVRVRTGELKDNAYSPGYLGAFSDTLGRFSEIVKYGFIDKNGGFLVQPKFDFAEQFSEGRALIGIGDHEAGKYGYIDIAGTTVVETQFPIKGFTLNDLNFHEGLAPVRIEGKIAFLDVHGDVRFKTGFDHAWRFSEGMAMVRSGCMRNGQYGFIDENGKVIIDLKFKLANSFSEGLAVAHGENWAEESFGYINRDGRFEISPKYQIACSFREGQAWCWYGDRINTFLAILSSVPFEPHISGTWELIDKTGSVKFKIRNGWVDNFSEGYALREYGGMYSYIDQKGTDCFNKLFGNAKPFRNGLAMVLLDGKWGYINRTGSYVWTPSE